MHRQAKIIATLGPATDGHSALTRLIKAGTDAVRLNCSHSNEADIRSRIMLVRQVAQELNKPVAVIVDLQGPKIRINSFKEGAVWLRKGESFTLDTKMRAAGDQKSVGINYSRLSKDCAPKDILLLDDGKITMRVKNIKGNAVHCEVINGGQLKDKKGVNKLGGGLSADALTAQDKGHIRLATELEADYIAVSFPRSHSDMEIARKLVHKAGGHAQLIAKIERAEVVKDMATLEAVVDASDGAMMARGDLGVEIGETHLIGLQKNLIAMCRQRNRIAITATQMMETMIENLLPTRAEVFDVANAVLDGTDAVMLSAETSVGKHPHLVVEAMARICRDATNYRGSSPYSLVDSSQKLDNVPQAITHAAINIANSIDKVSALVCLTETGSTVLSMSRINTRIPIYALSHHIHTLRRSILYRDVIPLYFAQPARKRDEAVLNFLREKRLIKKGERIILTFGTQRLVSGFTNSMRVLQA